MRTAYLCGPMTGLPYLNFDNFFVAEEMLQKAQWNVLNPARMDTDIYGYPKENGYPHHNINKKDFIWRDIRAIMTLTPAYEDALVCLPGKERTSLGATAELALAEWIGVRIITLEEALNGRA